MLRYFHGLTCKQFSIFHPATCIILFFFTILINPLIHRRKTWGKQKNSCYFSQWKIFNCFKILVSKTKCFSDNKKLQHGKWKLANNKIHLLQQIFPRIYQRIFHTMKIFTLFSFFICLLLEKRPSPLHNGTAAPINQISELKGSPPKKVVARRSTTVTPQEKSPVKGELKGELDLWGMRGVNIDYVTTVFDYLWTEIHEYWLKKGKVYRIYL